MYETNEGAILMEKLMRLQMLQHRRQMAKMRAFGPFGSPLRGQGRVLSILKMQPTISQKQLSYLLDMRQQSLSELLAKLERNGLIERAPSEDDRRAAVVSLTDKGREASEDADAPADGDSLFNCLSAEERSTLSGMLDRLIAALEADGGNAPEDFRRPFGPMHPHGFGPGFGPGRMGPEGPFGGRDFCRFGGPDGGDPRQGEWHGGHRGTCREEHHRERHGERRGARTDESDGD